MVYRKLIFIASKIAICHPMEDMATARIKRVFWLVAGWALLAAGAIGFFLPLPGVALMALGLLVLSTEYVWAHSLIGRLRDRFPKTVGAMEKYSSRTAGH
jgi:hypothetical protein